MNFLTKLSLKLYGVVLRSKFIQDTRAVTAIEYALIAVAISAMLFVVLGSGDEGLINKIKDSFKSIQDALTVTKEQSGSK